MTIDRKTRLVQALGLTLGLAYDDAYAEITAANAAWAKAVRDGRSIDRETREALRARMDTAHTRLAVLNAVLDEVHAAALALAAKEAP